MLKEINAPVRLFSSEGIQLPNGIDKVGQPFFLFSGLFRFLLAVCTNGPESPQKASSGAETKFFWETFWQKFSEASRCGAQMPLSPCADFRGQTVAFATSHQHAMCFPQEMIAIRSDLVVSFGFQAKPKVGHALTDPPTMGVPQPTKTLPTNPPIKTWGQST